jgi:hypothetical protein
MGTVAEKGGLIGCGIGTVHNGQLLSGRRKYPSVCRFRRIRRLRRGKTVMRDREDEK